MELIVFYPCLVLLPLWQEYGLVYRYTRQIIQRRKPLDRISTVGKE